MGTTQVYWINKRPIMTVVMEESHQYGRCYYGTTYKVTSTIRITREIFHQMFLGGVFGAGQEFNVLSQCDGKEVPAGFDAVPAVVVDKATNKEIVGVVAINEYSKEPYKPMNSPFYEYRVERRVDSGD
jgi:hypothetical protein